MTAIDTAMLAAMRAAIAELLSLLHKNSIMFSSMTWITVRNKIFYFICATVISKNNMMRSQLAYLENIHTTLAPVTVSVKAFFSKFFPFTRHVKFITIFFNIQSTAIIIIISSALAFSKAFHSIVSKMMNYAFISTFWATKLSSSFRSCDKVFFSAILAYSNFFSVARGASTLSGAKPCYIRNLSRSKSFSASFTYFFNNVIIFSRKSRTFFRAEICNRMMSPKFYSAAFTYLIHKKILHLSRMCRYLGGTEASGVKSNHIITPISVSPRYMDYITGASC